MLRRDILKKQEEKDLESSSVIKYKSNLKHTQFHDYMDNSYDKWKWFFNYVKDTVVDDDYIKELNSSLKDTTTVVDSMLKDTVSPRVTDIDETVLPDTIEATLGRMQAYHTKNQNAISELNVSDTLKEKLNDWNDAVYALVVDIKKKINESIVVKDNENYAKDFISNLKAKLNNTEEMETIKGTYVAIDVENHEQLFNWFKDQGIEPIVSTEMHCTIAYSRKEFNIDNYIGRIIIKPEQFIGIEELGNEGCAVLKYNSDELQSRFNACMSAGATYDYDSYIPHTTFALNLTKEQISKLKVPNFDIVLVGEHTDELNIEWKSKINKDEESIMDKKDNELFGFGQKYQSTLTYTKMDDYLKGSGFMEAAWEVLSVEIPDDKSIEVFLTKLDIIKKNYEVGVKPVAPRVVSVDNHIINDKTHEKIMSDMADVYEANKKYINEKAIGDKKTKLNQINDGYYNILKRIRNTLRSGIKPVSKDKESYMVSGVISTVVASPIEYMDAEGFNAISGLVANGFKKVSSIITEISDAFTVSTPDYSKLTKGFIFDKNKKFQDVYNTLVGVPAGYTGYVFDVSEYVVANLHYINTLDKELDNTINILSMYINSADYRESFILDLTTVKAIESIAKDLFESNRKYITNSTEDSKTIGKLIRSANEIDAIVDNLKEASKLLDLKTLESIKFKMKQIDNLVSTMIDNKNVYSKNKLLELAKLIDAIISLSNGVSTVVYLKNSSDIILEDIRVIL